MKNLMLVLHNIRSIYNVGAILRTCDGLGIQHVIASGYTPYPGKGLPHEQQKLQSALHKTALGAEQTVFIQYIEQITTALQDLKSQNYHIYALEQGPNSINLTDFKPPKQNTILILGEEVHGIPPELLKLADNLIEIPMHGRKESFNVSIAAAIALWELTKPA